MLVLPKYACPQCAKLAFDKLKDEAKQGHISIVTNQKEFKEAPNVYFDANSDRITRFNPFNNRAYFALLRAGNDVQTMDFGVEDLGEIEVIY